MCLRVSYATRMRRIWRRGGLPSVGELLVEELREGTLAGNLANKEGQVDVPVGVEKIVMEALSEAEGRHEWRRLESQIVQVGMAGVGQNVW